MPDEQVQRLEGRIVALERELADLRQSMSQPMQTARIERYRKRWNCGNLTMKGDIRCMVPVLFLGEGSISIGANVLFGWNRDPFFFDGGYILIDARNNAHIEIGDDVTINNNCAIIAEGEGVSIGTRSMIGWSVEIFDSDFHDLHPARRRSGVSVTRKVTLGQNTLIGAHSVILKGSRIGDDAVIGHGSLVSGEIPPRVVAAGRPARTIRQISGA
ncbi:MAG TPA: acyltransferase [Stellaceae bacterium]|jgi:maltose O-acetyltransferase|nr:acyltransferase [Stellaceae bacterium]